MSSMLYGLRDNTPLRIARLAAPQLSPAILAGSSNSSSGGWALISLAYGDATSRDGPIVRVATTPGQAIEKHSKELAELIVDERDRLLDHTGIDEAHPAEPTRHSREHVEMAGSSVPAELAVSESVWAARVVNGSTLFQITARGVRLADVRFTVGRGPRSAPGR